LTQERQNKTRFFEEMYLNHSEQLFRLANAIVHNPDIAHEIVNEAYLALWAHIEIIITYDSPQTWLFSILKRRAIDEWRKLTAHPEIPLEMVKTEPVQQEMPLVRKIILKDLPDDDRELLSLRYEQGLSPDEIAARLQISSTACRKRISRAKRRCAKLLEEE